MNVYNPSRNNVKPTSTRPRRTSRRTWLLHDSCHCTRHRRLGHWLISGSRQQLGGVGGGGADRKDLLKSIQLGAKLRPAVTNDRSAPVVGGTPPKKTSPGLNSGVGRREGRGVVLGGSAAEDQASPAATSQNSHGGPLPGIGGLFANGIPTLKKTQGGVTTGRPNVRGTVRNLQRSVFLVAKKTFTE